jgi:hypothetical protein
LERNLEVTIKEHFEDMSKPYNISAPDLATGRPGGVYSLLDLQLINHRVDRPERIIECWAELRRRHLLFWHTTLAKIPVLTSSSNNWQLETPIKDIYLEPMSKPQNYVINIIGDFNNVKIPRHFELVVVFRMVGPIRKYIHKLTNVRHDQKRVADEEGQS